MIFSFKKPYYLISETNLLLCYALDALLLISYAYDVLFSIVFMQYDIFTKTLNIKNVINFFIRTLNN